MAEISSERKLLYYAGTALQIVGIILFLSFFFFIASQIGSDSDSLDSQDRQAKGAIIRMLVGFILIVVGGVIGSVGAKGTAGSGIILNPKKAREDLKPYSEMVGGMAGDAMGELQVSRPESADEAPVVVLKCLNCEHLNEEDSKFCQECGQKI